MPGMKKQLTIVECHYPNPEYMYGEFYLGTDEIGRADKVNGGWTLRGRRKVLSATDAAKEILIKKITDAKRTQKRAQEMLDSLIGDEKCPE